MAIRTLTWSSASKQIDCRLSAARWTIVREAGMLRELTDEEVTSSGE